MYLGMGFIRKKYSPFAGRLYLSANAASSHHSPL
jgi:hypothetical protein